MTPNLRPRHQHVAVLAVLTLCAACRQATPHDVITARGVATDAAATAAADAGWHYDVTVDEALTRFDIAITFAGAAPARLAAGDNDAFRHVLRARVDGAATDLTLDAEQHAVSLDGVSDHATVRYAVDMEALSHRGREARRVGRDLVAAPAQWLLEPWPLPDPATATLTLHLPPGISIAAPWPALERRAADTARASAHDGTPAAPPTYILGPTAFRFAGHFAIGHFTIEEIPVGASTLAVAVLDAPHRATPAGIRTWLATSAGAVAGLFDGFPVPRACVVVCPTGGGGGDPVSFGVARRGGGPSVILYLTGRASDAALADDWVATHELTHLGMPVMHSEDSWMSEGWVMYYTETLRARAGMITPGRGWELLRNGFARAQRSPGAGNLAEMSAGMDRSHSFQRVYWGGAAVAFELDERLRGAGVGLSLDDAMRELSRQFVRTGEVHRAVDLLTHLDDTFGARLGARMFTSVATAHLTATETPDVGVIPATTGPRAALHAAIMPASRPAPR